MEHNANGNTNVIVRGGVGEGFVTGKECVRAVDKYIFINCSVNLLDITLCSQWQEEISSCINLHFEGYREQYKFVIAEILLFQVLYKSFYAYLEKRNKMIISAEDLEFV